MFLGDSSSIREVINTIPIPETKIVQNNLDNADYPDKSTQSISATTQSANRKTYQLPPMKRDKERERDNQTGPRDRVSEMG